MDTDKELAGSVIVIGPELTTQLLASVIWHI